MQNAMSKAELTKLAETVALHLGTQWSIVCSQNGYTVKLNDQDGHVLNFNANGDGEGRIRISGDYPRGEGNTCYGARVINRDEQLPRITVADTKSARQIALDIKRRLLPPYLDIHARAVALKAQHDDYASRQKALLARLATIPGVTVNAANGTFDTGYRADGAYIRNGQAGAHSVSMHLCDLSEQQAAAVISIITAQEVP